MIAYRTVKAYVVCAVAHEEKLKFALFLQVRDLLEKKENTQIIQKVANLFKRKIDGEIVSDKEFADAHAVGATATAAASAATAHAAAGAYVDPDPASAYDAAYLAAHAHSAAYLAALTQLGYPISPGLPRVPDHPPP